MDCACLLGTGRTIIPRSRRAAPANRCAIIGPSISTKAATPSPITWKIRRFAGNMRKRWRAMAWLRAWSHDSTKKAARQRPTKSADSSGRPPFRRSATPSPARGEGKGVLLRDHFQRPVGSGRAEQRDRGGCDQHAARDESKDAAGAEALEEERDHKSTEHGGKPAPGIDEADSRRADARGI